MKLLTLLSLLNIYLSAQVLSECVKKVLDTNPTIQKQLNNYQVTKKDIAIAKSDYYPKLNLSFGAGSEERDQYNRATGLADSYGQKFSVSETSLAYTHNIFDGLSTYHKVAGERARTESAAYAYIEKVNLTAFEMVDSYLQQLKHSELLTTAKENVEINKQILKKVQKLYKSGLTTYSEVNKVNASFALSQSNYILQENNLFNARYKSARILGEPLDDAKIKKPNFNTKLPLSFEEALALALKNNPSLQANRCNIKSSQEQWKASQSGFYPKIDLEISQTMNDNVAAIEGNDDRFRAMIVVKYNFFNGFSDSSEMEKSVSRVHQEKSTQEETHRLIAQDLKLAYISYTMLSKQLEHIKQYKEFALKTLKLYSKEYDFGKRSLLDLLSVQNDLIGAKSQMINIEYSLLLAKYKILNSMGTMVSTILKKTNSLYDKVALNEGAL